jgi:hypothetical protein
MVLGIEDLVGLVEKYRQRKYNEDILGLEELGGKLFILETL